MKEMAGHTMSDQEPQIDINVLYELMGGMYIQLLRIYDLLSLIGPKEDVQRLYNLHASGKVLSPDPSLLIDEENNEN